MRIKVDHLASYSYSYLLLGSALFTTLQTSISTMSLKGLKIREVVVFLFCACALFTFGGKDSTLEPETSGAAVVDAVIQRIERSGLFPDEKGFLRRIAYVESKFGKDPGTYRNDYHGGIWQVDHSYTDMNGVVQPGAFLDTKDTTSHPGLVDKYRKIEEYFGIDWNVVEWEDLRKPLYSGLAARLYLSNKPAPIPDELQDQAEYWKQHYNGADGAGTEQRFIDDVMALERIEVCHVRLDVIFVLDSSGSIGAGDFESVRMFTKDVVEQLDIGSDKTRVGLITFSTSATVQFSLDMYQTNSSLLNAITSIPYDGGSTNTPDGLKTLIQQFDTAYGARPLSQGIPRFAIVVTDGQSNEGGGPNATIAAANSVHENNIATYAVGVGSSIDMDEIAAIATDPDSQYVRQISSFDVGELSALQNSLNRQACKAPAIVDVGQEIVNNSLEANQSSFFQLDLPQEGITISIDVMEGHVVLYASNKIQNPNEAFYDFKLEVDSTIGDLYMSSSDFLDPLTGLKKRQTTASSITVYFTIQGKKAINDFSMNTTMGDVTVPTNSASTPTNTTSTALPPVSDPKGFNTPVIATLSSVGATVLLLAAAVMVLASVVYWLHVRAKRRAREVKVIHVQPPPPPKLVHAHKHQEPHYAWL